MTSICQRWAAATAFALTAGAAGQALAWGDSGHRFVGQLAIEALPATLPAFLRTPAAAAEIGELSREPDRSRGAGRAHDADRDPGHFVDGDDQGKVLGGPVLAALPPTRAEYETALRAAGTDSWKAGYLPYSIIEGWQQLVKDFAYWRADVAGERLATDPRRKAWLTADRLRRERLVVDDLGVWSHYVGDASYPLHVTYHYNGWGAGPNANGYTRAPIHVPLEGPYVRRWVKAEAVRAQMTPYRDCKCAVEARTGQYLSASWKLVEPFYQLEKAGGFNEGDPRGAAFMTVRLAVAASELRDMVVDAWSSSGRMGVGYPAVSASDVEAGKAGDAYDLLYGTD
jgi:hypothetical protein